MSKQHPSTCQLAEGRPFGWWCKMLREIVTPSDCVYCKAFKALKRAER